MNTTFNHDYTLEYKAKFQPYMNEPHCKTLKVLKEDLLNHLNAILLAYENGENVNDWESFLAPQLFFFPRGVNPYLVDGIVILDASKLSEDTDLGEHINYVNKWRDEYAPEYSK